MAQVRIPPHNLDAEVSVLGSILIDKDAVITVAPILKPKDFYSQNHSLIYQAVLELFEDQDPIDLVTMTDKLKKQKQLRKIGGSSFLASLIENVPTSAHVEKYAKIVKDAALKRQLITASSKLQEACFDEVEKVAEILDKGEQLIFSLSQRHLEQNFISIKDVLAESFDRLDELHKKGTSLRGVPTGYTQLDDALAGMQPSNLLILAGRPSLGKTALALNIGINAAVKNKIPVGFFSLEMSKEELVDRLLVSQGDIDAWRLKTGRLSEEDFTKLSDAMGKLAETPFFIDDTPAASVLEMRTKARRLKVEQGIQLLMVDYLQLARSSRRWESRVQEVSEISQGLKNLARELKIPVLAISQLSRAVEARGTKEPQLADLRESGCLTGDSLILNAKTGSRITIKKLAENKSLLPLDVYALADNYQLKVFKMIKAFSSGKKKTYQLKTKSGHLIKASSNHPFLKLSGWISLKNLKEGDWIALPRQIKTVKPQKKMSQQELILLAHLLGDGCILPRQPFHYTNSEKENINLVKIAAEKIFNIKSRLVKQDNWYHLYLKSPYHLTHNKRHPISNWFKSLGLELVRAGEKQIPEAIFMSDNQRISLFLKHLWATDGNLSWKKQKGRQPSGAIYFSSSSQKMAYQVQHLLLRLGILSSLKEREDNRKKTYSTMYLVLVQGAVEQLKFLKQIGGLKTKSKLVNSLIKKLEKIKPNPNNDIIPKEVWQLMIKPSKKKSQISWRQMAEKMKVSYSGSSIFKYGLSRQKMKKIYEILKDKKIGNLADSDIYWDKIISIKTLGVEEVYDATVEGVHNFIANDIIVHNSIEQDADVVMFLYRREDEDLENITLKIAKHRNGPLKTIPLRFKGDRISFFSMETKREK